MDRVKKVTHQQLVDFINQQKPDRKIDSTCSSGKGIGCLLTQYCRKTFKNKITNVGYFSCLLQKEDATYKIICDEKCSLLLKKVLDKKAENYEQVQKLVKEFYTSKKYYKLLSQDLKSFNNTQWELNKTITVNIPGNTMCSKQVLHCYNHPLLAVLLNPIHADIYTPTLFEINVDEIVNNDGLKFASKSQTLVKKLSIPEISIEQKIEFGIRVAKLVSKDKIWNLWADNWLNGSDKSVESAYRIMLSHGNDNLKYRTCKAATFINTQYFWSTSYNVALAVQYARDAYSDKQEFNEKIIDIIEKIVNIKQ